MDHTWKLRGSGGKAGKYPRPPRPTPSSMFASMFSPLFSLFSQSKTTPLSSSNHLTSQFPTTAPHHISSAGPGRSYEYSPTNTNCPSFLQRVLAILAMYAYPLAGTTSLYNPYITEIPPRPVAPWFAERSSTAAVVSRQQYLDEQRVLSTPCEGALDSFAAAARDPGSQGTASKISWNSASAVFLYVWLTMEVLSTVLASVSPLFLAILGLLFITAVTRQWLNQSSLEILQSAYNMLVNMPILLLSGLLRFFVSAVAFFTSQWISLWRFVCYERAAAVDPYRVGAWALASWLVGFLGDSNEIGSFLSMCREALTFCVLMTFKPRWRATYVVARLLLLTMSMNTEIKTPLVRGESNHPRVTSTAWPRSQSSEKQETVMLKYEARKQTWEISNRERESPSFFWGKEQVIREHSVPADRVMIDTSTVSHLTASSFLTSSFTAAAATSVISITTPPSNIMPPTPILSAQGASIKSLDDKVFQEEFFITTCAMPLTTNSISYLNSWTSHELQFDHPSAEFEPTTLPQIEHDLARGCERLGMECKLAKVRELTVACGGLWARWCQETCTNWHSGVLGFSLQPSKELRMCSLDGTVL